ncbi:hypothetical protein [Epilithonimonas arachidiradicis]|uniref:Uncharacterized protein n=1 Tax=Epilithonimonas arachidiradicis TaxID=1617282 RepID=A0A420D7V7_9FLAO|nr:hypothetical protein [Epilithonimonas arachidiradicis]RKE86692.1 hypothetical protein BXY58_2517 [Epilithonimonas arachidiradicis]GGG62620.1 hypothetical protein GCM10007332_25900 [Epilithonimonas arachidiradicis]
MRKKLFFSFLFLYLGINGQNVQNTYLDALKLAKIYSEFIRHPYSANLEGYSETLQRYGIDQNSDNPFLKENEISTKLIRYVVSETIAPGAVIPPIKSGSIALNNQKSKKISDVESSQLSGLSWQSKMINGTVTFMAERFKAEMANTVLQNMFDRIQTNDVENIQLLFPKTLEQVKKYYPSKNANTYYSSDLIFLKQIIISDLKNAPENIAKSDHIRQKIPGDGGDYLMMGYYISTYSKQEYPIDEIIERINKIKFTNDEITKTVSMVNLLSIALRDSAQSATKWVNPLLHLKYSAKKSNSIKDLTTTFFYALIYQQLKFYNISQLNSISTVSYADKIQNLISCFNTFNVAYNLVREKKSLKADSDDYIKYTSQIIASFSDFSNNELIRTTYNIDPKYVEFIQTALQLYTPIIKNEYVNILPVIITELGPYFPEDINIQNMRAVNFIAQLGTAETSEDIAATLDSFALPIGSASIKRNSIVNISLNGYVGLTGGFETAYSDFGNKTKGNIGLAAPIGVSFTKNRYTLFASIIDLGTMVNVRLSGDENSYSGLKFEHFLSPGLGLYYNFQKSPVTIGFHYNYIPNLRTIKYEEDMTATVIKTNSSVGRLNFSILIDIPLLTIYSK